MLSICVQWVSGVFSFKNIDGSSSRPTTVLQTNSNSAQKISYLHSSRALGRFGGPISRRFSTEITHINIRNKPEYIIMFVVQNFVTEH